MEGVLIERHHTAIYLWEVMKQIEEMLETHSRYKAIRSWVEL